MKLNLCCGSNVFPGWINIDRTDVEADYLRHLREAPEGFVWPEPQRELAAWVKAGKPLDVRRHDVRQGIPFPDNSVDAIYIGQAIEHMHRFTEAPKLLSECRRVLKRGSQIRLTTPSMVKILMAYNLGGLGEFSGEQPEYYLAASPEARVSFLLFGSTGPGCTAENYEGHFHIYAPRELQRMLDDAGFGQCGPHKSDVFARCIDMGMSHSFAIEAVKP